MARQLVLLEASAADWRLDDATRRAGRRGVATARAVLATVQSLHPAGGTTTPPPAAA